MEQPKRDADNKRQAQAAETYSDKQKELQAAKARAEESERLRLVAEGEKKRLEEEAKAKEMARLAEKQRLVQQSKQVAAATKDAPFVNSLGMKFVPVPITGGPTSGKKVLFSVWDTRVRDYAAYAAANSGVDEAWKNPGFKQTEDHPVVYVSWGDAKAFCAWLTQAERAAGRLAEGWSYRLPSDHEWICAVGIGGKEDASASPGSKHGKIDGVYPWGGSWPPPRSAGNYVKIEGRADDGYENTSPVGSFKANEYGVYDMGGNVYQWCEDLYDKEAKSRVLRGGSWGDDGPVALLASYRGRLTPGYRGYILGFRCVVAGGGSP